MITEEATPLQLHLQSSDSSSQHLISWGLYQLIVRSTAPIINELINELINVL